MTTELARPLPLAPQKETTPGNYFVSNYPPFSFWTPEQVPKALEVLDCSPQPETPLGLYVHIPFCRKRCHFCYFKVYTDKNAAEIQDYNSDLVRELEMYTGKAFLGGRRPLFVYFGGGTPSYLSARQLLALAEELKRVLPWDHAEEVTFECEPGTLNESKLETLREIGVTRLSLGVENFSDHILEINGRAHRSPEIQRVYEFARSVGFPRINIDLIAGMVEETEENWRSCVEKTLAMSPDSVTIYQMEIPYNTTIYQRMKAEGRLVAPVADWETKRRWVSEAFAALEAAGYAIGSAYTAVKDPTRARFLYRDHLWRGADLLSLGVASFSHINGVHLQNEKDFEVYTSRIERGEMPIHRGYVLTEDERLIRETILQFKLGKVSVGYFQDKFGVDIRERFEQPLASLREEGILRVEGDDLNLTRAGLLQVDRLLERFFPSAHRSARYT
ncbi:MAG: coproporphyrinogen III oxidase family protein [Candidatus Omnitrophica bacterium]|nr:Oxygen-independent coproporphyrinogen III oxidase [bacterium]NUN98867.1 coproporphyrinogen III oxidase family protein [Candidatus Omnitrophota bacterium]